MVFSCRVSCVCALYVPESGTWLAPPSHRVHSYTVMDGSFFFIVFYVKKAVSHRFQNCPPRCTWLFRCLCGPAFGT